MAVYYVGGSAKRERERERERERLPVLQSSIISTLKLYIATSFGSRLRSRTLDLYDGERGPCEKCSMASLSHGNDNADKEKTGAPENID